MDKGHCSKASRSYKECVSFRVDMSICFDQNGRDMVGERHVPTPALDQCTTRSVLEGYATLRSLIYTLAGDFPGPNLGAMAELMNSCRVIALSHSLTNSNILLAHRISHTRSLEGRAGTCSEDLVIVRSTRISTCPILGQLLLELVLLMYLTL